MCEWVYEMWWVGVCRGGGGGGGDWPLKFRQNWFLWVLSKFEKMNEPLLNQRVPIRLNLLNAARVSKVSEGMASSNGTHRGFI